MTFTRAKKIFDIEFQEVKYIPGDIRIYKKALHIFDYDVNTADLFMTSHLGGYTEEQLKEIKYQMNYKKNLYKRQKLERA